MAFRKVAIAVAAWLQSDVPLYNLTSLAPEGLALLDIDVPSSALMAEAEYRAQRLSCRSVQFFQWDGGRGVSAELLWCYYPRIFRHRVLRWCEIQDFR